MAKKLRSLSLAPFLFRVLTSIVKQCPGNITPDARLPVMIWVHGGGNVSGSGSDWICDAGNLVLRSVSLGMPVIVVAIKYVLGSSLP